MPPPNLVDLECLNNTLAILQDTFNYLDEQDIKSLSILIIEAKTALTKTIALISNWKVFISKNSCLSLFACDINAIMIDILEFRNLSNNFQKNLNEFEYGISDQLSFIQTSAQTLDHFLESLSHVTISSAGFNELPTELSRYIKVGEKMKDAIEISEIKTELQSLRFPPEMNLPSIYMAIVGPSYMGKTQSAFTLSHLMTVFYVNLLTAIDVDVNIESSQEIYAPFEVISGIFKKCLRSDCFNMTSSRGATNLVFSEDEFQTLGLIYVLLTLERPTQVEDQFLQYININNIIVPKMTTKNFRSKIQGKLDCIRIVYFYSFRS